MEMNEAQESQLRLVVARERRLFSEALGLAVNLLLRQRNAIQELYSGNTLAAALDEIAKHASAYFDAVSQRVTEISVSAKAFDLLSGSIDDGLKDCEKQVEALIYKTTPPYPDPQAVAITRRGVDARFQAMQNDIRERLAIARFGFATLAPPQAKAGKAPTPEYAKLKEMVAALPKRPSEAHKSWRAFFDERNLTPCTHEEWKKLLLDVYGPRPPGRPSEN